MMSGLLKLMSRFGFGGYRTDFELSFKVHFIIDNSLGSRRVRCARSRPAHLHFCNGHRGTKDIMMYNILPDTT